MQLDDWILRVEGWRTATEGGPPAPSRAVDGALHILLRCRELSLEPTRVELSAADSIVVVFKPGSVYCDIEADETGTLAAVAPHGGTGAPTIYPVLDTDEDIDNALKMIQLTLSAAGERCHNS